MINHFSKTIFVVFLLFFTSTGKTMEGIIAVISGHMTENGQPLLCQNLESSNPHVKLWYYKSNSYDFVGVVNSNDTSKVLMGQNTVGFSLVGTPARLEENDNGQASILMRHALSKCGRIEDFENYLQSSAKNLVFNFGCIDSFGGAALFECIENKITKYDANVILEAPEGFLIRSNFVFSKQLGSASGSFRFNRALTILKAAKKNNILNVPFLTNNFLRDIHTEEYPVPQSSFQQKKITTQQTVQSINKYNTVCSIVMSGQNPELSHTPLWCALGEPICTLYLPIWSQCGELHPDLSGEKNSVYNEMALETKNIFYPQKDLPKYLDLSTLLNNQKSVLISNKEIEKETFDSIQIELKKWHNNSQFSLSDICHFQHKIISEAIKQAR